MKKDSPRIDHQGNHPERDLKNRKPRSILPSGGSLLFLTGLLCLQIGCSTTQLPSFSTAQNPHLLEDEAVLWNHSQIEEESLLASDDVYDDVDFDEYTTRILNDLLGSTPNFGPEYQVRIIQDPSPNAFAYPHGSIYLSSGLLSELTSEAQLAMVLAHEVAHVQKRHAIRQQRQRENKAIGATVLSAVAITALLVAEIDADHHGDWAEAEAYDFLGDLFLEIGDEALEVATWASIRGYGRKLEREADESAWWMLQRAGYDVEEASSLFDRLDDLAVSSSSTANYLYSNPRHLERRLRETKQWVTKHSAANPGAAFNYSTSTTFPDQVRRWLRTPEISESSHRAVQQTSLCVY